MLATCAATDNLLLKSRALCEHAQLVPLCEHIQLRLLVACACLHGTTCDNLQFQETKLCIAVNTKGASLRNQCCLLSCWVTLETSLPAVWSGCAPSIACREAVTRRHCMPGMQTPQRLRTTASRPRCYAEDSVLPLHVADGNTLARCQKQWPHWGSCISRAWCMEMWAVMPACVLHTGMHGNMLTGDPFCDACHCCYC